jgi:hypothetical protein
MVKFFIGPPLKELLEVIYNENSKYIMALFDNYDADSIFYNENSKYIMALFDNYDADSI